MRYAARVDEAQPALVKALESMGFGVISTARLGGEAPDLIVGKLGLNLLVEVKTPRRERHDRAHAERQDEVRARWPGAFIMATGVEPILEWFRAEQARRRPLA